MTDLRQRIYEAISKPACDRCQSRMDWGPSDCDKHRCHALYDKETDAVMGIIADIVRDKERAHADKRFYLRECEKLTEELRMYKFAEENPYPFKIFSALPRGHITQNNSSQNPVTDAKKGSNV